MNKGSEWRKWDLHIHTPGTAKNDNYGKVVGGNKLWLAFGSLFLFERKRGQSL